jgi:hypothetical protein
MFHREMLASLDEKFKIQVQGGLKGRDFMG